MATLYALADAGALTKVEVRLGFRQLPLREFFALPGFATWLTQTLPGMESSLGLDITPVQQMDDLLHQYLGSPTLVSTKQFRVYRHVAMGVWYLKTPDLRVFGWFPARDKFVAARGVDTNECKTHNLYHGFAGETVRLRTELGLDEPKFVPGGNEHAVLSL